MRNGSDMIADGKNLEEDVKADDTVVTDTIELEL